MDQLKGRLVVCVCNIKPATLGGLHSNAMMIGAANHGKVELLDPPKVMKRERREERGERGELRGER